MESENSNIINDFLPKLKDFIKSENVIGEPYVAGDVTLIPINSVKVGFGYGGGGAEKKSDALGGGGGVLLTPVAFVIVKGNDVTIHSLNSGTIENVMTKVPDVVEKFIGILSKLQNKDPKAE